MRFGLIGAHIRESRSPVLHQALGQFTGCSVNYDLFPCHDHTVLGSLLEQCHQQGLKGLNITAPFKKEVLRWCEDLTEEAREAGSVNTLCATPSGWMGHSTDGVGLCDWLQAMDLSFQDREIVILGDGGVVSALWPHLQAMQASCVWVASRHPQRTSLPNARVVAWSDLPQHACDVVVQATSMQGALPPIKTALLRGALALDLNYHPSGTTLWLDEARRAGASRCLDGQGMLAGQAAASFEFWTQRPVDRMRWLQHASVV